MHIVRRGSWYDWNKAELRIGYKNLAREWHHNPGQVIMSYSLGKFLTFYGTMTWIPDYPFPHMFQSIIHWFVMTGAAIGMVRCRRNSYAHVFYLYAASTQIVYQIYLSVPRYALSIDILMLPFAASVLVDVWRRRLGRSAYVDMLREIG